jgi:hypothetical protein
VAVVQRNNGTAGVGVQEQVQVAVAVQVNEVLAA